MFSNNFRNCKMPPTAFTSIPQKRSVRPLMMMRRDIEKSINIRNGSSLNGTVIIKRKHTQHNQVEVEECSYFYWLEQKAEKSLPAGGGWSGWKERIKKSNRTMSECIIWMFVRYFGSFYFGWLHDWGLLTFFHVRTRNTFGSSTITRRTSDSRPSRVTFAFSHKLYLGKWNGAE